MFPSICCIINIINNNQKAFIGDTNITISVDGIAPNKGPKKGIIFVIPIITDINNVYGILTNVSITNVRIPIMNESNILPPKNLPNV